MGIGDADVNDDRFVRLVYASQVMNSSCIRDAGGSASIQIRDFGEGRVGVRLASEGISVLLVVQAGREHEDVQPCGGAGYGGTFGGCAEVGEGEKAGGGEGEAFDG